MAKDPYRYFRPEARDLVDQFAKGVLELEKDGGGTAAVQRLLRVAHTLKGAARVVRQSEIANRAHAIEDTLAPFRDAAQVPARTQIDAILAHLDGISRQLDGLSPPEGQHRAPLRAEPEFDARTIRAGIAEMDAVLDGVAEAHAVLNGLRGAVQSVEEARHLAEVLQAQLGPLASADGVRASSGARGRLGLAEELCRKFGRIELSLAGVVDQMDRELRQLREAAERLRLMPADALFTALARTARDAAVALGKGVAFEGSGADIRLDSHVIESVQGALIQLVRNAVAHGIESEAERRTAGKPPVGQVSVHVSRRGRRIVFECRDDGRGIDLEGVRRVAMQRGMPAGAARELDADALVRMLLEGGISTSTTVTAVSGRGVGLDVVREAVARLGGEVVVRTIPAGGTTVELVVPPSLAAMDALIVESQISEGSTTVTSLPIEAVRATLRVPASEITCGAPGAAILYEQKAIPFIPLATALDDAPWSPNRSWTAVVVGRQGGLAAVGVDRLVGTGRIVARPLPPRIAASPLVAGASLDIDGNPQLVLDPDALVAAAQRGSAPRSEPARREHHILVVDDSLTTRMLEQSILESAGYDVDVAVSAEDALEILEHKRFALILVDVEMPGIDGFTFIERIRSDPRLRDIPAVLVTSRASPEDLKRGREVGAHGHIAKSEFDQANLLATIKPLMR